MTEREWLDCVDPERMLNFLHEQSTYGRTGFFSRFRSSRILLDDAGLEGKLKQFLVFCCSHVSSLLDGWPSAPMPQGLSGSRVAARARIALYYATGPGKEPLPVPRAAVFTVANVVQAFQRAAGGEALGRIGRLQAEERLCVR